MRAERQGFSRWRAGLGGKRVGHEEVGKASDSSGQLAWRYRGHVAREAKIKEARHRVQAATANIATWKEGGTSRGLGFRRNANPNSCRSTP